MTDPWCCHINANMTEVFVDGIHGAPSMAAPTMDPSWGFAINSPALGGGMDSEIKVVPGFEDEARREEHRSSDSAEVLSGDFTREKMMI